MTFMFLPLMSILLPISTSVCTEEAVAKGAGYSTANSLSETPSPSALTSVILPVRASLGTSIVRLVLESLSTISHSFSPNKALVTPFRAFPVTTILLPTLPCAGIKLSITGALAIVSFIDKSSHETRKHAASRNVNIYFIFFIRFSFYSLILITSILSYIRIDISHRNRDR